MKGVTVGRQAMLRLISHGRHHLPLAEALKAGLVCAAPAVLAAALHAPLLCWSAIATFWTCLADDSAASARSRLINGLLFGVLGALASGVAIAAAPVAWLAIALTGIVVYAGGLARTAGATPGLRGLLLATACAVSVSFPVHAWPAPLYYAASFLGGSVWAVACMVGLWQYSDEDRARRATFAYLDTMSRFVRRLAQAADGHLSSNGPGCAALRARLDGMKRVVDGTLADAHPAGTWRTTGERAMALLAGLDSLVTGYGFRGRSAGRLLAPVLYRLAQSIEAYAGAALRGEPFSASAQSLHNRLLADLRCALIRSHGTALPVEERAWLHAGNTIVMAVITLADENITGQDRTAVSPQRLASDSRSAARRAIDSIIREVRTGGRVARYALRLSVAAMVAAAIARFTAVEQGYWLVLTTMFVVQPTVSQTVKISSLRVWGTVLGAIVASIAALIFHNPLLLALAIVPLATGTFAARALSYVSYILFLTPHFILVAHLGTPAGSPRLLAALRIGNSLAGALVAVVASVLAWPEWERRKLDSVSTRSVTAVSTYLEGIRELVSGGAIAPHALAVARRNACTAIDDLHALAAAMRLEVISSGPRMQHARDLVVHLRRLVGIASPVECLAAGMNERDRQRLAMLGSTCIALLRGDTHEGTEGARSLHDTPPRHFVDIAERDAVQVARHAGLIGRRMGANVAAFHR